jgi:hypothetical protein
MLMLFKKPGVHAGLLKAQTDSHGKAQAFAETAKT